MTMITHNENASISAPVGEQIGAHEDSLSTTGAEPLKKTTTVRKARSGRAKAGSGPAVCAIGEMPSSSSNSNPSKRISKQDIVLELLQQADGATIDELTEATGWQVHSVRGFLSGTVRKKLKLRLLSDVVGNGVRRYRVVPDGHADPNNQAEDQRAIDDSTGAQGA